ncbi:MAG: right-handed parallel beta-helix repeat-containing protein [Candidatus Coatesbacteria bacterium]|nr:right-handed parallel beta-helix repeat-containing protein [Candidatus Coatesbacteria bacterium]
MRGRCCLALLLVALFAICIVGFGVCEDRYVDGISGDNNDDGSEGSPWRTITYALNSVSAYAGSSNSVVIHVSEGTYSASANGESFPLQMISYVSLSGAGPEKTTLDAQNSAYHLIFCSNVTNLHIEGFLMTGGNANGSGEANTCGGAIWCDRSSPVIRHNIITGNHADNSGGGLMIKFNTPIIYNNLIYNNSATYDGGGIGGYDGEPIIANCTIANNTADRWGDGISLGAPDATVTDCIFWGNGEDLSGFLEPVYSCVQDEAIMGEGNIHLDPKFTKGPLGDFYLDILSPCINAGSKTAENAGLSELTTQADESLDTAEVDMGYHYNLSSTAPPTCTIIVTSPPDFFYNTILLTWTPVEEANHYYFEYSIGGGQAALEWGDTYLRLIAGDQPGWNGYVGLGTMYYRVSAMDASGKIIDGPTEWFPCTCY